MSKQENEIIRLDQVVKSPRGRKKVIDPKMIETLEQLVEGAAILIRSYGVIPAESRADFSAKVRKHFTEVFPGRQPSVNYSPEGYPQVSFRQ